VLFTTFSKTPQPRSEKKQGIVKAMEIVEIRDRRYEISNK
jgi:hypothetical protein